VVFAQLVKGYPMNRLLPGVLLATIAFGLPNLVGAAQAHGLFVVVADGSGQRGGFQPDSQPRDVANTIARVSVFLPQKDVRLPDGQIVTGFRIDGWTEGDGVRIVVSALVPADGTNRYVEVQRGMHPASLFGKREFNRFALAPGENRTIDEMKALGIEPLVVRLDSRTPFQGGQGEPKTSPPAAQDCVPFETPSRVLARDSFTAPIGKGLEFRLRPEPAGTWNITVGPAGTPLDYLWVVSPPFQIAPHRQIGRGYHLSATESAQLSPRRFRFVTTPQEYEEAARFGDRAGRDPATNITAGDITDRGKGSLELWITGFDAMPTEDSLRWIAVRGRACQPQ
jgi:hypothetical protein